MRLGLATLVEKVMILAHSILGVRGSDGRAISKEGTILPPKGVSGKCSVTPNRSLTRAREGIGAAGGERANGPAGVLV